MGIVVYLTHMYTGMYNLIYIQLYFNFFYFIFMFSVFCVDMSARYISNISDFTLLTERIIWKTFNSKLCKYLGSFSCKTSV